MARTGRFGRTPRVAQSLTSTLVAIAREFQRTRDQNLMDAWQKGGTFEGQKATDELVLAHWRMRMAGVSHDDPLYDTYKNAHTQLDYSIHESKMTAAYATGHKTDGQMIAFYLGWAKKVPKNSEFYRVLQRDAGQYMRQAKASSDAARRRAEEALYQKQQANTRSTKEAASEFLIDTVRRMAQSGYADGGIAQAIAAPGSDSDFSQFDPGDPAKMAQLLAVIMVPQQGFIDSGAPGGPRKPTTSYVGNTDALFYDDNKHAVTGADIMAQLTKLSPSLEPGQKVDSAFITQFLDTQIEGLTERINRANKTGHITDANNLSKAKEYYASVNRQIGSWPVQRAYNELRASFEDVRNDPSASPAAVLNAWNKYANGLTQLSKDPRIATDDAYRSRIVAEANGDTGVPTLAESSTGLTDGQFDPQSAKDSADIKAQVEFLTNQVDSVNQSEGAIVWTYGVTKGEGANAVFVPQAGGNEIGAAPRGAVEAGGVNPQTLVVDDPAGNGPLTMMVTATPVYAVATNPVTGETISSSKNLPIAYAYDQMQGGKIVTRYGFQSQDAQGNPTMVFSADPPWGDGLTPKGVRSDGQSTLELDLTPLIAANPLPSAPAGSALAPGDIANLPGFSVGANGKITFDPLIAAPATRLGRVVNQFDPATDFTSLTLSFLHGTPDGQRILSSLDKNPAFQSAILNDVNQYAGSTWDPKTGAWDQTTADPSKLQYGLTVMTASQTSTDIEFLRSVRPLWSRETTGSALTPTASPAAQTSGFNSITQTGSALFNSAKLPSDQLAGTAFASMGSKFKSGTNILMPPAPESGGLAIKVGDMIRVPDYKPVAITPPPVGVVTSTPQSSGTIPGGGSNPYSGGGGSGSGSYYLNSGKTKGLL